MYYICLTKNNPMSGCYKYIKHEKFRPKNRKRKCNYINE